MGTTADLPPPDSTDPIIKIKGLGKTYDSVVALEETTLEINRGEFFTLLGPSGAGKSTLLQLLGGFVTPSVGQIFFNGTDHTDSRPQERPVSTVFQEYALFPHMSVEQNVRYGLQTRRIPKEKQDELLSRYLQMLEIDDLRDRSPSEISGGQRQRVALARSLVVEPDILLLDEPLGSLDEKLRRQMQVELSEIQEALGTTFVYVTHDQEEALTMSDRIALLDQGRIVETGTPEEMYSSPMNEFTASFLGSGNIFRGEITGAEEDTYTVETELAEEPFVGVSRLTGLEKGDEVVICVRDQHIKIGSSDEKNQVSGILDRRVYKGDAHDYIFEIVGGHQVTASIKTPIELHEGDEAVISWDTEDCLLVQSS